MSPSLSTPSIRTLRATCQAEKQNACQGCPGCPTLIAHSIAPYWRKCSRKGTAQAKRALRNRLQNLLPSSEASGSNTRFEYGSKRSTMTNCLSALTHWLFMMCGILRRILIPPGPSSSDHVLVPDRAVDVRVSCRTITYPNLLESFLRNMNRSTSRSSRRLVPAVQMPLILHLLAC